MHKKEKKLNPFSPLNEFKTGMSIITLGGALTMNAIGQELLKKEAPAEELAYLDEDQIAELLDAVPSALSQNEKIFVQKMGGYITEHGVRKIIAISNECANLNAQFPNSECQLEVNGFAVQGDRGEILKVVPFSIGRGWRKGTIEFDFSGSEVLNSNGFFLQLAGIVNGNTLNTLSLDNSDLFIDDVNFFLPAYGVDPEREELALMPVFVVQESMTALTSVEEFQKMVVHAFSEHGLCGFVSPRIAEQRRDSEPFKLMVTDDMGREWFLHMCQHIVMNEARGPSNFNVEALPEDVRWQYINFFTHKANGEVIQDYPMVGPTIEFEVTPETGLPFMFTIFNRDTSQGRPLVTSTTMGFPEELVEIRSDIPESSSTLKEDLPPYLGSIAMGALLVFHAYARVNRGMRKPSKRAVRPEVIEKNFDAEFMDKAERVLIAIFDLEMLPPENIVGTIELLNQLTRILKDEKESEVFFKKITSASLHAALVRDVEMYQQVVGYTPNTLNKKDNFGHRLIRNTLAYLYSATAQGDEAVQLYNEQVRQVQSRFKNMFTDFELIGVVRPEKPAKKTVQVYVESEQGFIPLYDQSELIEHLHLPIDDTRAQETSLKEITHFVEVALRDRGDFLDITRLIEDRRGRFDKFKVGGDSAIVTYRIVDKNQQVLGHVLIDINVEERQLRTEFYTTLPSSLEMRAQDKKMAQQSMVTMEAETAEASAVEYSLDEVASYLMDTTSFLLQKNLVPETEFESVRQEWMTLAHSLAQDSRVKKEVIRRLADEITALRIHVYEGNVKPKDVSREYARVIAARVYEYLSGTVATSKEEFSSFTQDALRMLNSNYLTPLPQTAAKSWATRTDFRIQLIQVMDEINNKGIAILFTKHDH